MLLSILVLFTLIPDKQAHYLEPAVPGLVLWLAWRIASRPHELAWLRRGIHAQFGLLLALVGAVFVPRAWRSAVGADRRCPRCRAPHSRGGATAWE